MKTKHFLYGLVLGSFLTFGSPLNSSDGQKLNKKQAILEILRLSKEVPSLDHEEIVSSGGMSFEEIKSDINSLMTKGSYGYILKKNDLNISLDKLNCMFSNNPPEKIPLLTKLANYLSFTKYQSKLLSIGLVSIDSLTERIGISYMGTTPETSGMFSIFHSGNDQKIFYGYGQTKNKWGKLVALINYAQEKGSLNIDSYCFVFPEFDSGFKGEVTKFFFNAIPEKIKRFFIKQAGDGLEELFVSTVAVAGSVNKNSHLIENLPVYTENGIVDSTRVYFTKNEKVILEGMFK